MNPAVIFWTTLVGVLAYVLAVEPLFFNYMLLQVARFSQHIERQWVKMKIHPDSPWVRYQINRNADKIATKLQNEINGTQGKSDNDGDVGGSPMV